MSNDTCLNFMIWKMSSHALVIRHFLLLFISQNNTNKAVVFHCYRLQLFRLTDVSSGCIHFENNRHKCTIKTKFKDSFYFIKLRIPTDLAKRPYSHRQGRDFSISVSTIRRPFSKFHLIKEISLERLDRTFWGSQTRSNIRERERSFETQIT